MRGKRGVEVFWSIVKIINESINDRGRDNDSTSCSSSLWFPSVFWSSSRPTAKRFLEGTRSFVPSALWRNIGHQKHLLCSSTTLKNIYSAFTVSQRDEYMNRAEASDGMCAPFFSLRYAAGGEGGHFGGKMAARSLAARPPLFFALCLLASQSWIFILSRS